MKLDPLEVRIIDFDCAFPDTIHTESVARGTPGYFPQAKSWRNGSTKWDMWALAALICEADMPLGEYPPMLSEDKALKKIRAHLQKKTTCANLANLMGKIVFAKRED